MGQNNSNLNNSFSSGYENINENINSNKFTINEVLDINNITQIESFTNEYMDWLFGFYPLAGITVSIVNNDSISYMKGYGYANIEESSPVEANETMFKVASISKLFVWISVMQLWENNQIDLDEDINTYLEGFQVPSTFDQPITMQNLMDHNAGFDFTWSRSTPQDPWNDDALENFCIKELPKRIRPPGEYAVYSSYSATLASYIVQCITNTKFEDYVEENILAPLNMTKSTFYVPLPENLAQYRGTGYQVIEDGGSYILEPKNYDYRGDNPASALSTTSEDMSYFMKAILQNGTYNNQTILLPNSVQKMLTQSFAENPHAEGWANGWQETKIYGNRFVGHGGDHFWFKSAVRICPELNFGVFISTSTDNGHVINWDFIYSFMDAFFPDETNTDPLTSPFPEYQQRAKKFSGNYATARRSNYHFTRARQMLGFAYTFSIEVANSGHIWMSDDDHKQAYIETEENVFYPIDEEGVIYTNRTPIVFLLNENGKISHLLRPTSGFGYDKIGWFVSPLVQQILLFSTVGVIVIYGIYEIVRLIKLRKGVKENTINQEKENILKSNLLSFLISVNSFVILLTAAFIGVFLPESLIISLGWQAYPNMVYFLLSLPLVSLISSSGLFVIFLIKLFKPSKTRMSTKRILFACSYFLFLVLFYIELNVWRLLGFYL